MTFPSGSWAEVVNPGFSQPQTGRRYLLLLRRATPESAAGLENSLAPGGGFVPAAGGLAVFDVTGNPRATPSGARDAILARKIWDENISAEELIQRVREIVRKSWPLDF